MRALKRRLTLSEKATGLVQTPRTINRSRSHHYVRSTTVLYCLKYRIHDIEADYQAQAQFPYQLTNAVNGINLPPQRISAISTPPKSSYTITTTMTSTKTPNSRLSTLEKDTPQPNFTSPTFDPAEYLNDTLPPLTLASTQPNASRAPGSITLPELATQVQSLVSQVNAQNIRHSGNLTQLTDEILRGGGRLAYEVEVLRGEAIGLSDVLTEGLRGDIGRFVLEGDSHKDGHEDKKEGEDQNEEYTATAANTAVQAQNDPDYITKLRTLNQVRARLDEVVHTFGDAMEWPLPPSELSLTSSFISVSAPEPGSESHSLEQKGQEVMQKLRAEVTGLLDSEGGGEAGLEAASRRVDSLREFATVWKSSAEEKARNRFVDSLAKIVEDRQKVLESTTATSAGQEPGSGPGQSQQRAPGSNNRAMGHQRQESEGPGGGIFRNLQRLREEIYLD